MVIGHVPRAALPQRHRHGPYRSDRDRDDQRLLVDRVLSDGLLFEVATGRSSLIRTDRSHCLRKPPDPWDRSLLETGRKWTALAARS
jgi:hypothetical protein